MSPRKTPLRRTAKRLAIREYLPLASWLLTWLLLGLTLGHADLVRLLAAYVFVQAVRAICTLEVIQVLARRSASDRDVKKASRRRALKLELAGLGACIVAVAGLAAFLEFRDMRQVAAMIVIVALGIPARHPGLLLVRWRERDLFWRLGAGVTAIAGATLVFVLELPWQAAAAVFAVREWGGLLMTMLFGRRRAPPKVVLDTPLTFHEAAVQTEASARKRLGYRLMRTLLMVALGPVGNFAARTGRSAGRLDQKIARLVPHNRIGFVAFTGTMLAAAIALLSVSREPASVLVAAACARLAASGGAVLIWWNYRDFESVDGDDDADE